ncbi:MAG: hypothetical protein LBH94_07375, partial [Deltaproteobacteria bacterium]|nr:hypothetical protein [Deltaproteobacteria bacterium]
RKKEIGGCYGTDSGIFLYDTDQVEGENVQNAHVFDGTYDNVADQWIYQRHPSRCGRMTAKQKASATVKDVNPKRFCSKVVEGHGTVFNACGMCMASFFADDD